MNGRLFLGLTELTQLNLSDNQCIDQDFNEEEIETSLTDEVDTNCGFTEANDNETNVNESGSTTPATKIAIVEEDSFSNFAEEFGGGSRQ